MQRTSFQERLGLQHPIIQGPFGGGLSTIELTSIVSNAGGLGSFGAHMLSADGISALAKDLRRATDKPFALNLWIGDHDPGGRAIPREAFERAWEIVAPFYREYGLDKPEQPVDFHPRFEEQIDALIEARPHAFSFVFGIPSRAVLAACRQRDIVTIGAATTPAEAQALDGAGVDVILATGFEAGGHRPSFLARAEDSLMGTLALTRIVALRVQKPVVAAGGIVDGRGIRAAIALGASAAQLGTAFLACTESGTAAVHRDILFSDRARHTVLTRAYTGRLARGIPNRIIAEMEKHKLPPFPVQSWFVSKLKAAAMAKGDEDFLSLYAGQGAPLLKHRSADGLMKDLAEELARPI
jgi:nitronate monooxygenase